MDKEAKRQNFEKKAYAKVEKIKNQIIKFIVLFILLFQFFGICIFFSGAFHQ